METGAPKPQARCRARRIALILAIVLCFIGFGLFAFWWLMGAFLQIVFATPFEAVADWIGDFKVEDRGGDYRITHPSVKDPAR